MKLAFIGLGKIGSAMVRQLLINSHDVTVFNRALKKAEPLKSLGASVALSVQACIENTQTVRHC